DDLDTSRRSVGASSRGTCGRNWVRFVIRTRCRERWTGTATAESGIVTGTKCSCPDAHRRRPLWQRVRFKPEHAGGDDRIDASLLPPRDFIATAMQLAMMAPAATRDFSGLVGAACLTDHPQGHLVQIDLKRAVELGKLRP